VVLVLLQRQGITFKAFESIAIASADDGCTAARLGNRKR